MDIIMVILDSLRQDHVGAYGNTWIQTPNLDAFAEGAVKFTRCYAESMPTLPARRTLHTARRTFPYQNHSFLKGDVDGVPGWGPIPEDHETLSEILGRKGYRSALISDCYHLFKSSKNFHRGFDVFRWIRGQEADRYRSGPPVPDSEVATHLNETAQKNTGLVEFLKMYKRNTRGRHSEEDYFPARVFSTAAEWYRDNLDAENLFLVVDCFDPHEPWDPPENYRRMYDPDDDTVNLIQSPYHSWQGIMTERELVRLRANYAGEVTLVDRWFGHLYESIKASGRMEKTAILVISDHGHNLGYDPGDRGMVGKQGHPMTRGVADLVAFLRHPSGEAAGTVCEKLIYNHDLSATLLAFAGAASGIQLDGVDVWPAVVDPSVSVRDSVVLGWGPNITVIDDRWWYTDNIFGEGPLLYDMTVDPHLENDLAGDYPGVCRELLARAVDAAGGAIPEDFREWRLKGNSKLWVFGSGEPYCTVETLAKANNGGSKLMSRLKMLGY